MFVFTTRQAAGAIGQPRGDEIMHAREAARQTVGERLLYAARGVGPGTDARNHIAGAESRSHRG